MSDSMEERAKKLWIAANRFDRRGCEAARRAIKRRDRELIISKVYRDRGHIEAAEYYQNVADRIIARHLKRFGI
jgi:hypothetical protein